MFWSDRLRRLPFIHRLPARLRTGSGLVTLALVLAVLSIGGGWAARHSARVHAEVRAQAIPTPTFVPTLVPKVVLITPTATLTPTATAAPTFTITPTRTPQPTATVALTAAVTDTRVTEAPVVDAASVGVAAPESPLATPAVAIPLPADRFGPHVVPPETDIISDTVVHTATVTAGEPVTASEPVTLTLPLIEMPAPTPIPTATESITAALALPVPVAGLGAMVATAESVVVTPESDAAAESDAPAERETPAEAAVPPTPAPTPVFEPTPDGTVRTAHVPVLMYHYLSVPPADADVYRLDLSVTPDLFAQHLDAMRTAGYTTITPYQLLANLTQGAPLPEKPVMLTFDDGYRDNYEHAFPLLRERGMTATFFVISDFIDDQQPAYLTWDMVREMYAGGMSIESHGRNHVSLKNKDTDYLVWQALGSLETIQYELGVRPRFVAYPAGDYDQQTIDIFQSAGYWAGFVTQQGATHAGDDLFELHRVRVRGTTTPDELIRLLELDW